jgi:HD-like signal output (HDOD) protein/predicted Ser/Thr protein kinase
MTLTVSANTAVARPKPNRSGALDRILSDTRLPTPPAVAMQIVQATSRADCEVKDVVELLARDPAICGQVLKVINSCVYGLTRPVTTIERAVVLLGLNTVRGIVLTFSLPAMRMSTVPDKVFRNHCLSAVSGAIMARELSVRARKAFAEDDLVCGLLRDLGSLLLRHAFPREYDQFDATRTARPFALQCATERELFGVDHPTVSAELLRRWHLPDELVEPIRFHHEPGGTAGLPPAFAERAELLGFVEALTNLDLIAQQPTELKRVLGVAEARFGMKRTGLVEFLREVLPKVQEFSALLNVDVGACPDFAAILEQGSAELAVLAVQSGRIAAAPVGRTHAASAGCILPLPDDVPEPGEEAAVPFRPEFVERFPAGGCVLDGYRLERVIGRGAMGVVFRGYEPALDRPVAIKLMSLELAWDEDARMRFAREARSIAAVRHENVVGVYTVRDTADTTFLVMECVDGESLQDRLDREHRLPVHVVVDQATQILRGLAAAHARKVIHRDVKPANVLVEAGTGRAKLTDFGLARIENEASRSSGASLIGTPLYMSPEQVRGEAIDPRTDLFSLGSTLVELVTGAAPFDAPNTYAVLQKVCEYEPPPLRSLEPEVPEWFDRMVMKLLQKKPEHRFGSADEAGRFLDQHHAPDGKRGGWKRWLGL